MKINKKNKRSRYHEASFSGTSCLCFVSVLAKQAGTGPAVSSHTIDTIHSFAFPQNTPCAVRVLLYSQTVQCLVLPEDIVSSRNPDRKHFVWKKEWQNYRKRCLSDVLPAVHSLKVTFICLQFHGTAHSTPGSHYRCSVSTYECYKLLNTSNRLSFKPSLWYFWGSVLAIRLYNYIRTVINLKYFTSTLFQEGFRPKLYIF